MIIEATITGIDRAVDEQLFEKLIQIYPQGDRGVFFFCEMNLADTRCVQLLKVLDEHEWRPKTRGQPQQINQYEFYLVRHYEESDYTNCQYFVPDTLGFPSYNAKKSSDGSLLLEAVKSGGQGRLIFSMNRDVIVDDSLRAEIVSANLSGYKFKPVTFTKSRKQRPFDYCELTSETVLPPVSPSTVFVNNSAPMLANRERYYNIVEPPYSFAELHYPAGAFDKIEPFDFAVTHEQVRMKERGTLVVSQAFRHLCKRLKIDVYWVPIRFDPPQPE